MNIFDLSSDMGHVFEFRNTIPSNYKGIILPHGAVYSLHGGFGDFVFQQIVRPYFDLWYSNYLSKQRFKTHARADVSLIEMSIQINSSVSYALNPNSGKVHQRGGQFNIFNSLAMDNRVQFEKSAHYTTLDIHAKPELLARLYALYPELMEAFMNAIAAGRDYMYLKKPLYMTPEMIALADHILKLSRAPILDCAALDKAVFTLFAHGIVRKIETTAKGISHERRHQLELQLQELRQTLYNDELFRSTEYYASTVGMSASTLRRIFRNLYGSGVREFWQLHHMESAYNDVVYTNKTFDDIALANGYVDQAAFSKAFKKIYGFAPQFFRKNKKL